MLCIAAVLIGLQLMGAATDPADTCIFRVHLVSADGTEEYAGVKVSLIQVAGMTVNGVAYNDDFLSFGKSIPQDIDEAYTDALADYAAEKKITGNVLITDNSGKAVFEDLSPGMYLIVQQDQDSSKIGFPPFVSILPSDGVNDVTAEPKITPIKPKEDNTSENSRDDNPPPQETKLVQTGIEQRPVPVLFLAGLLLLTAGVMIRIGENKRNEG